MSTRQLASLAVTVAAGVALVVGSLVGLRADHPPEAAEPMRFVLDDAVAASLAGEPPSSVLLDVGDGVVITVEPAQPLVAEPRQTG
jgi:hypothetical protein